MDKEYTYQELVDLGKSLPCPKPHCIEDEILVLRDSQMIWTDCPSPLEIEAWRYMVAGMSKVLNVKSFANAYLFGPPGRSPVTLPIVQKSDRSTGAATLWGLPAVYPLTSIAALFYLLYTRHLREDICATGELRFLIGAILPHIKNYLDMVSGGEARHMSSRVTKIKSDYPQEILEEALNSPYVHQVSHYIEGERFSLTDANGNLLILPGARQDRTRMWGEWKSIRQSLGIYALDWCILTHLSSASAGYGGPLWANAANLVREHELNRKSDIFLIDQAFSLQHNGGILFNKLSGWDISGIGGVLTYAANGEMYRLPVFLNQEHKVIYNRVCREVTKYDHECANTELKVVKEWNSLERSAVLQLAPQEAL